MRLELLFVWQKIQAFFRDGNFVRVIHSFENLISKFLALVMMGVIVAGVLDLLIFLVNVIVKRPIGSIGVGLIEIFGLFLNILIAFEILENVMATLNKSAILELVVATALTAVARKIIIFDTKSSTNDIAALGLAVIALALSYWIIRQLRQKEN